jgi:hypothetical protein
MEIFNGIQDDAFDVVIDKSLLDCVFHCDEHEEEVEGMLEELHRVLRKDSGLAVFITIQPESKVSSAPLSLTVSAPWLHAPHSTRPPTLFGSTQPTLSARGGLTSFALVSRCCRLWRRASAARGSVRWRRSE